MEPVKDRIYLAPMSEEHITRYMSLSGDPDLITTMGWTPFRPDERDRFLSVTKVLTVPGLENGRDVTFSIITTANDKGIGYVSIKGINEAEGRAEVGIALMNNDYRGHGYGTEALRQAVDYAFNELGLNQLGLTVFPSNRRAVRAYEKIGFKKAEVLRDSWLLPDGRYCDMWLMELSR